MKYINADNLIKSIDGFKSVSCTYLRSLIENDKMIKVSEIRNIINYHRDNFNGFMDTKVIKDLYNLIEPQPKKYGGLTVDEWEQLKKLNFIVVSYNEGGYITLDKNSSMHEGFVDKIKLKPDPEGFYRAHIGYECPVPGNVDVSVICTENNYNEGLANEFDWLKETHGGIIKAYRILGVSG